MTILEQLPKPPAAVIALASALLGLVVAGAGGWIALRLGAPAVLVLVAAFVAGLWRVRGGLEFVSDAWPGTVPLPPGPGPVEIDGADDEDPGQDGVGGEQVEPVLDLVQLSGGRFLMGSDPSTDRDSFEDERPQHWVRLDPFRIARTPVTRGQWRRVMAAAAAPWRRDVPSAWSDGDDDLPATHLTWFEVLAFCNAASVAEGLRTCYAGDGDAWTCNSGVDGYRLPTEAEWEYACRGDQETPWFWGDQGSDADRYAWYASNSDHRLHPVGTRKENGFGLFDMSGNCWEWCWDWLGDYDAAEASNPTGPLDGRLRVLRGGSFVVVPWNLRSANRNWLEPVGRGVNIGFRCVRSRAPAGSLVPSITCLQRHRAIRTPRPFRREPTWDLFQGRTASGRPVGLCRVFVHFLNKRSRLCMS